LSYLSDILATEQKDYTTTRKKRLARRIINEKPKIMGDLIERYRKTQIVKYDFTNDPSGDFRQF